jgi:hypothetical protein
MMSRHFDSCLVYWKKPHKLFIVSLGSALAAVDVAADAGAAAVLERGDTVETKGFIYVPIRCPKKLRSFVPRS